MLGRSSWSVRCLLDRSKSMHIGSRKSGRSVSAERYELPAHERLLNATPCSPNNNMANPNIVTIFVNRMIMAYQIDVGKIRLNSEYFFTARPNWRAILSARIVLIVVRRRTTGNGRGPHEIVLTPFEAFL